MLPGVHTISVRPLHLLRAHVLPTEHSLHASNVCLVHRAPLQRLHVAHTRVSAAGCQDLLSLQNLQYLDVRGTGIPGAALRPLQHRFLLTVLQGAVLSRTPAPVVPTDLFLCCCDPTTVPPDLGSDVYRERTTGPHSGHTQLPDSSEMRLVAWWLADAGVPACDKDSVLAACHGGLEACVPQLLVLTQANSRFAY